jgi:E3 ubiquitin ligase SMURF1/2
MQDSVYPRAHTCFNKLDLPLYDNQRELDAYLSVVINMENMTGFTIE